MTHDQTLGVAKVWGEGINLVYAWLSSAPGKQLEKQLSESG